MHALRGNYPKYLYYRCLKILSKYSKLQLAPCTGMCRGCTVPGDLSAPDLAPGILIYSQDVAEAAGDRAGKGDPVQAGSSWSRTGLFTSSKQRFGKITVHSAEATQEAPDQD